MLQNNETSQDTSSFSEKVFEPKEFIGKIQDSLKDKHIITEKGSLNKEGRIISDELYENLMDANEYNYAKSLEQVREMERSLKNEPEEEGKTEKLKLVRSLRGKIVYQAHLAYAKEAYKKDETIKESSPYAVAALKKSQLSSEELKNFNIYEEASKIYELNNKKMEIETVILEKKIDEIMQKDLSTLHVEKRNKLDLSKIKNSLGNVWNKVKDPNFREKVGLSALLVVTFVSMAKIQEIRDFIHGNPGYGLKETLESKAVEVSENISSIAAEPKDEVPFMPFVRDVVSDVEDIFSPSTPEPMNFEIVVKPYNEPTPEVIENTYENYTNVVATAEFPRANYYGEEQANMKLAADTINKYFEEHTLSYDPHNPTPFSFLEVMNNFQDPAWTTTSAYEGSGACNIATLMQRAIVEFGAKYGHETGTPTRDDYGHYTVENGIFQYIYDDHSVEGYERLPEDEISVYYAGPDNPWNSDFRIGIKNTAPNGNALPKELGFIFNIYQTQNDDFEIQLLSNFVFN